MAMATPKKSWIAALLALVLGGPGCFYLGRRRGVLATIAWMFPLALLLLGLVTYVSRKQDDGTLEMGIMFLFLAQAGLARLAYSSCKRTIAEAAKNAESPEPDPIQLAQAKCVKEIRDMGMAVTVMSGLTFFSMVPVYDSMPPMSELGRFGHWFAPVLMIVSIWGVATGIGLRRAFRWAWISMLVFGGILAVSCSFLIMLYVLMPGGEMQWWHALLMKAVCVLVVLPPAALGLWCLTFFLRANIKSFFGIPRKAPELSA